MQKTSLSCSQIQRQQDDPDEIAGLEIPRYVVLAMIRHSACMSYRYPFSNLDDAYRP